ncbi:hypothetical protein CC78DRAFT_576601 [Lojkania enalia]|uniref:Uncharacterized protein n=1 Tax=Lojkania enalia TaxID=147567 RepID=A0A9P4N363_9PLEO|nr:hypothetical protein CC78DRAFT_576601 [Didymosphaeria enalia]
MLWNLLSACVQSAQVLVSASIPVSCAKKGAAAGGCGWGSLGVAGGRASDQVFANPATDAGSRVPGGMPHCRPRDPGQAGRAELPTLVYIRTTAAKTTTTRRGNGRTGERDKGDGRRLEGAGGSVGGSRLYLYIRNMTPSLPGIDRQPGRGIHAFWARRVWTLTIYDPCPQCMPIAALPPTAGRRPSYLPSYLRTVAQPTDTSLLACLRHREACFCGNARQDLESINNVIWFQGFSCPTQSPHRSAEAQTGHPPTAQPLSAAENDALCAGNLLSTSSGPSHQPNSNMSKRTPQFCIHTTIQEPVKKHPHPLSQLTNQTAHPFCPGCTNSLELALHFECPRARSAP